MAAIVLMNLGGPSTLDDVRPFLKNLFSDPMIIELPGGRLTQPLFARMISTFRSPKVRRYYERIGGGSPLLRLTREQAAGLGRELEGRGLSHTRVVLAMRYTAPDSDDAIRELLDAGEKRVVALPLYPQECVATTGSSLAALEDARNRLAPEMEIVPVRGYHLDAGYLESVVERIRETLESLDAKERAEALILFSAHGVPESLPRRGDPYVSQIRETVAAVARMLALPNEHRLAFQSRTGPVRWVGPGTEETIEELAGHPCVVVVPIAFVSDHIETLYEIDILFREVAERVGIGKFVRAGSLNGSPRFARALADIVEPLLRVEG
jgi:protoporphyrin/coproporphyrin ferrochelatase